MDDRHGLPVLSVAVLLRPKADGPLVSGFHERRLPHGVLCHKFHYAVVRVSEVPVEQLLPGGLPTLPLALIADLGQSSLVDVATPVGHRFVTETELDQAREYWAATGLLAGLRLAPDIAKDLLVGGLRMDFWKESSVYQIIVDEGRAEGRAQEARAILLKLCSKRFGPPDAATRSAIERVGELDRLEMMTERLFDATRWLDLLENSTRSDAVG
ncbi:MAG: hypothetical protein P4L84_19905 [Isosphaeraceae bacterium]|nr:hypothetical protein [Isosphaeraceae bacterium]